MAQADKLTFDRREIMRQAVYLVGGAAALSVFGVDKVLAAAAAPFFSAPRLALLDAISSTMIPATDTPGAHEVGVAAFIDAMMANWASDATRNATIGTLDMIDAAAQAQFNQSFANLSAADRLDLLRRWDASAIAMDDKAYKSLKSLILTGYYLSEPGATVELRYIQVPGAWHADIPFSDIGRAWAVG